MSAPFPPITKRLLEILVAVLLLFVPSVYLVDNHFKALTVKKEFDGKQKNAAVHILLDKIDPLQIQIAFNIQPLPETQVLGQSTQTNTPASSVSILVNHRKIQHFLLMASRSGEQKYSFLIPPDFLKKGENLIDFVWEAAPGYSEIKITNYHGISPNAPVAYVVFADNKSIFPKVIFRESCMIFAFVFLCAGLYFGLIRLMIYKDSNSCFSDWPRFFSLPASILWLALAYSFFTPYMILFPTNTLFWLITFFPFVVLILTITIAAMFYPDAIGRLLPHGERAFLFASNLRGNFHSASAHSGCMDAVPNEQPGRSSAFLIVILATLVISIFAYRAYFENGWYAQDDYFSLVPGGANSTLDSARGITEWLYSDQHRYQPVRLFLFSAFAHTFEDKYAVYYNFALHMANLILLSLLLRKFRVYPVNALVILLVFSLFGRYRVMESPSVMIGGSGLNLFFIIISSLSLIKTLEIADWNSRKYAWSALSLLSYLGLTFSYEVAFPLILVIGQILHTFHIKNYQQYKTPNIKTYLYLLPYLSLLLLYYFLFRRTESPYVGAKIAWNSDIIVRLSSYLAYTFSYPVNLKLSAVGVICLTLYFIAIRLIIKSGNKDCADVDRPLSNTNPPHFIGGNLTQFGLTFYFSSTVLFILNNQWGSPSHVMTHHTYLMTAGSSILLVGALLVGLQWFFVASSANIHSRLLTYIVAPFLILSGINDTLDIYKNQHEGTASIRLLKDKIQSSIKDPGKIDAILIKNFFPRYYGISSMSGAFLQWFDFKKFIYSGREITYVKDNIIKFKGPLTWYFPPDKEREVDNNKTELFYTDDVNRQVLSYFDFINIESGENTHQLKQVMKDGTAQCETNYLEAILKNTARNTTLAITLDAATSPENFLGNISKLELNGMPVNSALAADNIIYTDLGSLSGIKYIFLKIVSADKAFKQRLQQIELRGSQDTPLASFNIKVEDHNPGCVN